MVRTPEKHRVKTLVMAHSVEIVAGTSTIENAAVVYAFQEDVTIIGWNAYCDIPYTTDWDSGRISYRVELSRVGAPRQPGMLEEVEAQVQCGSKTSGVIIEVGLLGLREHHSVFCFPEGRGVDLDDGESIYLNAVYANSMANNQANASRFIIYYVER